MKVRREYVLLLLIIAALSLYIFFPKRGKRHYRLPELKKIAAAEISSMTITKPGETITLERDGGRWLILPEQYPADGNLVAEMAEAIGSPTLTALASESKNYPIYELDENHKIAVEITGDGKTLRKMEIGKTAPSFRHTFVKIEGDHRVYHATGDLKSTFDREASALRDMRVLTIDEEVAELTIREGKKAVTIVRRQANPPLAPAATADTETDNAVQEEGSREEESRWVTTEGKPAVDKAVEEIIDAASDLRCDGFVEGGRKEDLKNPLYTLSLKGSAKYELSLYKKKEDQYVATSSGSDYPFLIAGWKAAKIKKSPKSLVK